MRILLLLLLLLMPATVLAATSVTGPPGGTGLEPPDTPLKGRKMPEVGGFPDAYGHIITPYEEERKPKERLRNGAYGGPREKERPLPDPKDDTPVW